MSKIITNYFRVPGPAPECDWTARYEDMEDSSPVGYGLTEADAILDLTMNHDTPEELAAAKGAV